MQRKYISIRKKDTIVQFEEYLKDANLENYIFRLPNKISESGIMGRSASLTQLISTWARKCDSPILKSYISSDSSSEHENFVSNLHNLAAVYFSNAMFGKNSERNIRNEVLRTAKSRIDAMYKENLKEVSKGRNIELISILRAKREFLPALYKKTPNQADLLGRQYHGNLISSPSIMNNLFLESMNCLNIPTRSKSKIELLSKGNLIGLVLHEAFRNTAEHAYLTTRGMIPSDRRLRCVLFKYNEVSRDNLSGESHLSSSFPTVAKYFKEIAELRREYSRRTIHILEISILDSGPGFADTIKSTSPDSDDSELVARCFEVYKSRKLGANSGLGLYRILEAVRELRGIIRIRTSTCEAVITSEEISNKKFDPRLHIRGRLAKVVGTLLTICIPLAY